MARPPAHVSSAGTLRKSCEGFQVLDTTLRDGAQRDGISLTVGDKVTIARLLDDYGVGFIEGGWPGSNPRDTAFFQQAAKQALLRNSQLVAFGSTRKPCTRAAQDPQVAALLRSEAPVVTLVAKAHDWHVTHALGTNLQENLDMVADTVDYLRGEGRRVFVDCEHFFDGHHANPAYATAVVQAAAEAGAEVVVLCDTNGGTLPRVVLGTVRELLAATSVRIGIHAQDDSGCAVANTLAAVDAGATHVQCTANGYGERVGNADLFSVVSALELKYDLRVLPAGALARSTEVSRRIAEATGIPAASHQPYVGSSAFAHKAGLHASAIAVDPQMYQHIEPSRVGNDMRMVVSELAGRSTMDLKCAQLGYDTRRYPGSARKLAAAVKERERRGQDYQDADASFELLVRDTILPSPARPFSVELSHTVERHDGQGEVPVITSAVMVRTPSGGLWKGTGESGDTIDSVHQGLRRALGQHYGTAVERIDLKRVTIRFLSDESLKARVRVHVRAGDAECEWSCTGVGATIADASCQALADVYCFAFAVRYAKERKLSSAP
ncbi:MULTISPECIES: citramalate synthase [unclassified Streptomyces]|uniref:citramalate synthase n=1 Tax=unclassified Streptomyces TaxID=2593676 RepID=UPI00225A1D39|nr:MULTISPECIES: citramalate synthase [unclassified Streptomyces]MCX4406099.1 citramalate synthase [Streptomyces sp. NBC_01764]MCX5189376.1 citramalate synthase [Streptomyces sp. NBC_00268]